MSIQSMRRLIWPGRGSGSSNNAPAPSDNIQRRKSFSNASSSRVSRSAICASVSAVKLCARIIADDNSEPAAIALRRMPDATAMNA